MLMHPRGPDDVPSPAPETPPRSPPPSDPNLHTALTELLTNEALSDVTLISSDGVRHPAVRALLASRSLYFRNLLFGDFAEARASDVTLNFRSAAIRDILTYIYTDSCPSLTLPKGEKRGRLDPLVSSRRLAELIVAADYLAIPALSREANDALLKVLDASPEVACMVLQLTPSTLRAHDHARSVIRLMPRDALGVCDSHTGEASHGAVAVLSAERLGEVLADADLFASDSYLFQVLRFWAFHGASEARKEQARGLSKFINLERCKPTFLRDFVRPSGLVPEERLKETFEQQALEAERGRALFNNFRGGSVFTNGTKVLEASDRGFRNVTVGPWLTDGKHEWTFRVHKRSRCLWFGFAGTRPTRRWAFFAMEKSGWAFSADGKIRPQEADNYGRARWCREICDGDVVKITLNLIRTGTVTISSLKSDNPMTIFSGLRQQAKRFILALCVTAPAKVELVEEQHHFN